MPLFGSITNNLGFSQLNEVADYSGAVMLFQQTTAPLHWTKSVSFNDYILRIVANNNQTISTGGTVNFSDSVFATGIPVGFDVAPKPSTEAGGTTLTLSMIPNHSHLFTPNLRTLSYSANPGTTPYPRIRYELSGPTGSPTGTGTSHTHSTTTAVKITPENFYMNFKLKYIDCIIATFDY